MIRLGNIDYSNCYPIHGPVLERDRPPWLRVIDGPPADLNRRLALGELDVAPGSSIELARHYREYTGLQGLCIGSVGPVESIVLVSHAPLDELAGCVVALPTASASSRCLLRIILELRMDIRPSWMDFDQSARDPLDPASVEPAAELSGVESPASAALFIGDIALRRPIREGELRYDLGELWTEWTGLPFVYALWMVRNEVADSREIHALHRRFLSHRDLLPGGFADLVDEASKRYGIDRSHLLRYWSHIRYHLDDSMLQGLDHFLRLASELGEAPSVPGLSFTP